MFKNGSQLSAVWPWNNPQSITASNSTKRCGNLWNSFVGSIDEIRISNWVRSADWIATEYNNQVNPAAFLTVGGEENLGAQVFYKISAVAGNGGTITPAGDTMVAAGAGQTYTIAAASGYKITQVTVDTSPVTLASGQYAFTNVQANHDIVASFEPVSSTEPPPVVDEDIVPGCGQNAAVDYNNSSGFNESDFNLIYTKIDPATHWLSLNTGALDPANPTFIVPFTQNIAVTAIYDGAGWIGNDFGWMLADDLPAVKGDNPDPFKMHEIYTDIDSVCGGTYDDCASGGILKQFSDGPYNNAFNNRVDLGTFAAGSEIVFYLFPDCRNNAGEDWGGCQWAIDNNQEVRKYLFTKKDWDQGGLNSIDPAGDCVSNLPSFEKQINLGLPVDSEGYGCRLTSNWMSATALDRIKTLFKFDFAGATAKMPLVQNQRFQHALAAVPNDKPNEWILGWEDLPAGGDVDVNDLIFHVERQSGGVAQLKNPIVPASASDFITAVDIKVWDYIDDCTVGDTVPMPIRYYVSVDGGKSWVEVTQWDEIWESDENKTQKDKVSNWKPGKPTYTMRSFRVDFASLGQTGRELLWKAEMRTADLNCDMPAIMDVQLNAGGTTSGSFSRGAPVVKANVIYSGYYETPSTSWREKSLRGHLTAVRLYDPTDPTHTDQELIWDAGEELVLPQHRTIYFPDIAVGGPIQVDVTPTGDDAFDGVKLTFSGTLEPNPIAATSLTITDGREVFRDKHTDVLEGSLGGSGTINRFNGRFSLTFGNAPHANARLTATYRFYASDRALLPFEAGNVTKSIMGLDDTFIAPDGLIYDFNADGTVDDNDAHLLMDWVKGYEFGTKQRREWLLGAVDHSVPAVLTPPGKPLWYFGTATTQQERESFDAFRQANSTRRTVVFVGARDGMLHAFDGGKFREGDNPATAEPLVEKRGYFEHNGSGVCADCPDYGDGSELWAFIPANLLPRLKNNLLAKLDSEQPGDYDQAYVDASPAIADVYFENAWRTVLLSAEGNGGDSVFCMDITDPMNPDFLWEFADPDLFRSRSSPSVGKIGRILVNGAAKWVAFFVSGGDDRYDRDQYPSIYMIDIATGSVVRRVFLDIEPDGIGGTPSGQPTIIDSDGNGYVDRFYIGTDKGYLYRVNVPDDPDSLKYDISHCVVNVDFTDEAGAEVAGKWHYQPIYGSPVAIVDNSIKENGSIDYRVKLFFGTGDSPYYAEDINMAGTRYHFFAYVDRAPKGRCASGDVGLEWFYELPEGHRIFSSAFAAAGMIYFGTSTADTEDPCEGGGLQANNQGELFAFEMERPKDLTQPVAPKARVKVGNIVASPLVVDEHIYLKAPGRGLISLGTGIYNNDVITGGWPEMRVLIWREIF